MNLLTKPGEHVYAAWTGLTLLASFFVLLVSAWGWNWVTALGALSTVGLIIGVINFRSVKARIALTTLLSAIFVPVLIVCILVPKLGTTTGRSELRNYPGPPIWWVFFAIYIVQLFLSSLKLRQLTQQISR